MESYRSFYVVASEMLRPMLCIVERNSKILRKIEEFLEKNENQLTFCEKNSGTRSVSGIVRMSLLTEALKKTEFRPGINPERRRNKNGLYQLFSPFFETAVTKYNFSLIVHPSAIEMMRKCSKIAQKNEKRLNRQNLRKRSTATKPYFTAFDFQSSRAHRLLTSRCLLESGEAREKGWRQSAGGFWLAKQLSFRQLF